MKTLTKATKSKSKANGTPASFNFFTNYGKMPQKAVKAYVQQSYGLEFLATDRIPYQANMQIIANDSEGIRWLENASVTDIANRFQFRIFIKGVIKSNGKALDRSLPFSGKLSKTKAYMNGVEGTFTSFGAPMNGLTESTISVDKEDDETLATVYFDGNEQLRILDNISDQKIKSEMNLEFICAFFDTEALLEAGININTEQVSWSEVSKYALGNNDAAISPRNHSWKVSGSGEIKAASKKLVKAMTTENDKVLPASTDILGWGFDIFGKYSVDPVDGSKLSQLLDMSKAGMENEEINGTIFSVPKSVAVSLGSEFKGKATYLKTVSNIRKYFQEKAGVSGSFGGFSASVSVGYNTEQKDDRSNDYCIVDGSVSCYGLQIKNPNMDLIADAVKKDPLYQAVATSERFDPDNPEDYFNFFKKYGTHFVDSAAMGGRLYYYSSISTEAQMSSKEVEINAEAEYSAAFTVKASDKTAWGKVSKNWSQNRKVSIEVFGGNATLLGQALVIKEGDSFNDAFKDWLQTICQSPRANGFKLMSVARIFNGKQKEAMEEALKAYASSELFAELSFNGGRLLLQGKSTSVDFAPIPIKYSYDYRPGDNIFSASALIFDIKNGQLVEQIKLNDGSLPPALKKYGNDNGRYFIVFYWGNVYAYYNNIIKEMVAPSRELTDFLLSAGGGEELRRLETWKMGTSEVGRNTPAYPSHGHNVYLLSGVIGAGPNNGFEAIKSFATNNRANPEAQLNLLMIPESGINGTYFTFSEL